MSESTGNCRNDIVERLIDFCKVFRSSLPEPVVNCLCDLEDFEEGKDEKPTT